MPLIIPLDKRTIAKIAAGEVVERPLSVVKELMENAIDAGSTEIVIELVEGGLNAIRVSDNGRGMTPEDVELCVQSHTTSKLREIDDLSTLSTLGFRGEALYSIAAVARLTVTSKSEAGEAGHKVRMEGGSRTLSEAAARNRGTTSEVENLFYNVPARLKFQKSSRTEIQAVTALVSNYMIAYPEISFRLLHNGDELVATPAAETRMERIRQVLGKDIAAYLRQSGGALRNMELAAFFSMPDLSFSNRRYQIFFVNGHMVKDRTMQLAVDISYKGLVGNARYGLAVLFLDIVPSDADFNVHPAKTEIRFARPHDVHSLIYRTLHGAFVENEVPAGGNRPFTLVISPEKSMIPPPRPTGDQQQLEMPPTPAPPQGSSLPNPFERFSRTPATEPANPTQPAEGDKFNMPAPWENNAKVQRDDALDKELAEQAEAALKPDDGFASEPPMAPAQIPHFEILGQFFNTFILVKLDGKPVFIDQHIASERLIYNRLKRSGLSRPSQMVLLGEPVELPRDAHSVLSGNLEMVKKVGLEVEPFGDRAFIVRSVVHNAGNFDPAALLMSLAGELSSAPYAAGHEDLLERMYKATACELAIQGGQPLTFEDMQSLIRDYIADGFTRTCPHGRPIVREISLDELKGWFKR